jgi:ABC-type branched-subunit amino acid transport system substrate-binding protein
MALNGTPSSPDPQKPVQSPSIDSTPTAIATPDPDLPDPGNSAQLPPVDQQDAGTGKFIRARILFFISISIVIWMFSTNTLVLSVIPIIFVLLGVESIFHPVMIILLKNSDIWLIPIFKPFEWFWHFLFVKHPTLLGDWLKRHRRPIIDTVVIIAIVILLGATTLSGFVATVHNTLSDNLCLHGWPWFSCNSGLGVSALPNGVRIGLIANNAYGPFDQSPFNQDEMKVEELIFRENQRACTIRHITLVAIAMLSRTVEDSQSSAKIGLQELQGSYLAQHDYNATHPAVSICLAIANLGTADTADKKSPLVEFHPDDYSLPQVIHQIAQFAHTDSSVRGIVGFTYSPQAKEALHIIKDKEQSLALLPIISSSASDELSNETNFYRTVSPNSSQARVLAQFYCNNLIKNQPSDFIAMLRDSNDNYSRTFQSDFNIAISSIDNCGDPTHRTTISYTTGDSSSIREAIDKALYQHTKYILFPDHDQNMDTVELEIQQVRQENASDLTIIGGGGISNVDRTTYYSYTRVYATSSTGPLLETNPIATSFIQQGFSRPSIVNAIPSHLWIPKDTLLTYDGVNAFVQTVKNIPGGDLTQDTLERTLANISFEGTSGTVTFQGNKNNGHVSDREQGYIYITCNDLAHKLHLIAKYNTINDGGNNPPQNLPLSEEDGASTCS